MVFLNIGEWVPANLLFSSAFIVAGIGVVGLGYWVIRGDRLNRRHEVITRSEEFVEAPPPRQSKEVEKVH